MDNTFLDILNTRNELRELRNMPFDKFCADILGVELWSRQIEMGMRINGPKGDGKNRPREMVNGWGHSTGGLPPWSVVDRGGKSPLLVKPS